MNNLENALCQIPKFQYVHEHLFSSGQPTESQLQQIKEYGISTIINLALNDSPKHLNNEDKICLDLGLNYIQLPLSWDMPNTDQALFALDTIDFLVRDQTVWVHCSQNKRASALMFLYRQYYMNLDISIAQPYLEQLWEPNETWIGLIHSVALQLKGRKATQELQQELQHNTEATY
ncbi:protein tyrosine phosphatase family protein [Acinetobacter nectaris]|uniref:protein tyrosine phosphatase family protein n=1 Tax=Acinetobacter nectaris TaxID=1219382 RepID=UPI001F3D77A8|nr:protein tyrosine phosphatase family protein [Acinetobacter nectaris]MCF8998716.1 protein tyrosine phosphatase family protein [Acinetobacter nectaris]MCF9026370.1 protein tyrosine phosphatase family protein [Acinetobacter nectaris]